MSEILTQIRGKDWRWAEVSRAGFPAVAELFGPVVGCAAEDSISSRLVFSIVSFCHFSRLLGSNIPCEETLIAVSTNMHIHIYKMISFLLI